MESKLNKKMRLFSFFGVIKTKRLKKESNKQTTTTKKPCRNCHFGPRETQVKNEPNRADSLRLKKSARSTNNQTIVKAA